MTDPQNPDVPGVPPASPATPPAYETAPPVYDPPPSAYDAPPPAPEPAPPAYGAAPPAYGTAPAAPPAYGAAPPAPYGAPVNPTIPGKTMGIVAFILSFFVQLIALILGIVALVQSKKAGYKNGWAVAAIIISAVLMVIGIIVAIFAFAALGAAASFANETYQACLAVDFTGTVTVQGVEVSCDTISR